MTGSAKTPSSFNRVLSPPAHSSVNFPLATGAPRGDGNSMLAVAVVLSMAQETPALVTKLPLVPWASR